MYKSLMKSLTPINLAGAVIYHNRDHTYAKAFVGEGAALRCQGFSTDEGWHPCALELAIRFARQQGVDIPREQDPYAPPLPEPEPATDTETEAPE